jgi:prepilin-type N-terminal cleavage/methylation domain-containing protein
MIFSHHERKNDRAKNPPNSSGNTMKASLSIRSHSPMQREERDGSLPKSPIGHLQAFSLVELLVVMAIIAVLAGAMGPAFNVFMGAGGLAKAAGDISSTMQLARAYAMSKNTYVYVGMQEVDAIQPTASDGTGRLVVAAVASKGGTRAPDFTNGVVAISKAQLLNGAHLTTTASLSVEGNMKRPSADLDMSSTTAHANFQFSWPIGGTAKYTFARVIEFDPQGVARVQKTASGSSSVDPCIEIALVPARGNTVPAANANLASIQINGITGATRIFRP